MKKALSLLLTITILISFNQMIYADGEYTGANKNIDIPVTVKEQNGVAVKDYFFRRGVAIEKGKLYSTDNICITENGKEISSSAEVLQKHSDGSVAWLLISANIDIKPYEFKHLRITDGKRKKGTLTVEENLDGIVVKTGAMKLEFGTAGVTSVKYNNVEQLNSDSITIYAETGGKTDYLSANEVTVLKHTDSYAKIRLKGKIGKYIVGEMYAVIAEKSSKFEIEYRITAKEKLDITSTGLKIPCTDELLNRGSIINDDAVKVGDMWIISYDNTRFRNSTTVSEDTGFVIGDTDIKLAPIINGKAYTYQDGLSRTNHAYFSFADDGNEWDLSLINPPAVVIDSEQFVRAGIIRTTDTDALVEEVIKSTKAASRRNNGRFDAGGIPLDYNAKTDSANTFGYSPGELDYNIGYAYMQTGDNILYNLICTDAERRADMFVYKGKYEDFNGEARYKATFTSYQGFMSHGYYSDEAGFYMVYLLSGNEYIGEIFELSVGTVLKLMYKMQSNGTYGIVTSKWDANTEVRPFLINYMEARSLIRARTMYLAYLHFNDDRYLRAAKNIVQWAKNVQLPDGSFYQAVLYDGSPFDHQVEQLMVKDYVTLYGFRGITEMLKWTDDDIVKEVTIKFSDYLCEQNKNYGPGIWNPNGNMEVCATNEDGSRGISPLATILAVDVLCSAYELTEDEKYLENLLEMLEMYLCTEVGGLAHFIFPQEGFHATSSSSVELGRATTLLKCSDILNNIIRKNRAKVEELGFENISLLFSDDSSKLSYEYDVAKYDYPEVTQNVYLSNDTKILFAANNDAPYTGDYEKDIRITVPENALWQGEKNIVKDNYRVILNKYTKQYGLVSAIQRPVYVDEISGEAEIYINDYSQDKIEMNIIGDFEIGLRFESGRFDINPDDGYNVTVEKIANGVKVIVSRNGNIKAQAGKLYIRLNSSGYLTETVGFDTLSTGVDKNMSLSAQQIKSFIKQYLNKEISIDGDKVKWREFAPQLLKLVSEAKPQIYSVNNVMFKEQIIPNETLTEDKKVDFAAEVLDVKYDGDELSSDVFLAKKSLFDCDVTWHSEREDILSKEGILSRNNVDVDKIRLTATVTKGTASKEKVFEIPLKQKEKLTLLPAADFEKNRYNILPQTENFEITFTCLTKLDKMDAIVIFGDSAKKVGGLADAAFMVRFAPEKIIDSMNLDWYYADNVIPYEKNKKYTFRMVFDMENGRYDSYVTPEGGEEILIGKGYLPRGTAGTPEKIDVMYLWTSSEKPFEMIDCSLFAYPKNKAVNEGMYDENGLMFGKYDTKNKFTVPQISDNNSIINWLKIEGNADRIGNPVWYYFGVEDNISEKQTALKILKKIKITDYLINEDGYVTAADISRFINIYNYFDSE